MLSNYSKSGQLLSLSSIKSVLMVDFIMVDSHSARVTAFKMNV